jgi:hypothetical protein
MSPLASCNSLVNQLMAVRAGVGVAIAAQWRVFGGQAPPHARQAAPEGI